MRFMTAWVWLYFLSMQKVLQKNALRKIEKKNADCIKTGLDLSTPGFKSNSELPELHRLHEMYFAKHEYSILVKKAIIILLIKYCIKVCKEFS